MFKHKAVFQTQKLCFEAPKSPKHSGFSGLVGAWHLGVLALDTLLPLSWLAGCATFSHCGGDPLRDETSLPGQPFPLPTLDPAEAFHATQEGVGREIRPGAPRGLGPFGLGLVEPFPRLVLQRHLREYVVAQDTWAFWLSPYRTV